MIVLALDTATARTSVAVVGMLDGREVSAQVDHVDARRHAEVLPRLIRTALDQAAIGIDRVDIVACGVGPGPFTGLRVGVATALAIGAGRSIPVVGLCSLDVIADEATRTLREPVTVLTRARRGEVAWATYDTDGNRIDGPVIRKEDGLRVDGHCVGDAGPVDVVGYPSAAVLAGIVLGRLAAGEGIPELVEYPEDPAEGSGASTARVLSARLLEDRVLLPPVPIYLRRPDAVVPMALRGDAS